jgi:hypothetical protein
VAVGTTAPDLDACEQLERSGWAYSIGFFSMLAGHRVYCPACKLLLTSRTTMPQDSQPATVTAADLAEHVTEAQEQSTTLQGALRRYAEVLAQVRAGTETHGVLGQHEQTVLDAGGTWADMHAADKKGTI